MTDIYSANARQTHFNRAVAKFHVSLTAAVRSIDAEIASRGLGRVSNHERLQELFRSIQSVSDEMMAFDTRHAEYAKQCHTIDGKWNGDNPFSEENLKKITHWLAGEGSRVSARILEISKRLWLPNASAWQPGAEAVAAEIVYELTRDYAEKRHLLSLATRPKPAVPPTKLPTRIWTVEEYYQAKEYYDSKGAMFNPALEYGSPAAHHVIAQEQYRHLEAEAARNQRELESQRDRPAGWYFRGVVPTTLQELTDWLATRTAWFHEVAVNGSSDGLNDAILREMPEGWDKTKPESLAFRYSIDVIHHVRFWLDGHHIHGQPKWTKKDVDAELIEVDEHLSELLGFVRSLSKSAPLDAAETALQSIPIAVRANNYKLFPKGELKDRNLTELAVKINTEKDSGRSFNEIAREFTGETKGNCRKANSYLSQLRRLRSEGRVVL